MSVTERYATWLTIRFVHGYYPGEIPSRLIPSGPSREFFRKTGLLFRYRRRGIWELLRLAGGFGEDRLRMFHGDAPVLSFDLIPSSPLFHYVTCGWEVKEGGATVNLRSAGRPKVWAVLEVDFSALPFGTELGAEVRLTVPEKRMEFILIPRYTDPKATVRLEEFRGRLAFSPPRECLSPDGSPAYRVTSHSAVILRHGQEFRLRLWEVRDSGERLLSDCVPPPRPDELSLYHPRTMIATYFYY